VKVRLTQIDGKIPNLALMNLAAIHRDRGDEVVLRRTVQRDMLEPAYGAIYGSTIFTRSAPLVERFRANFPDAIVGVTCVSLTRTVDDLFPTEPERYDYSIYPDFTASIGFSQRGCRQRCGFCTVPEKEGTPKTVATIVNIWRGEPWPKDIVLLDNDFFGQPRDEWRARIAEIRAEGYRVSFNQGINLRRLTDDEAAAIASVPYYDGQFSSRRIYTAWDNIGDERIFVRGVERLVAAGVKAAHIMVYMLIGYDPAETWERIHYRHGRMIELGVKPYPMVFDPLPGMKAGNDLDRLELHRFQTYVIRGYSRFVPWTEFRGAAGEGTRRKGERSREMHLRAGSLFA
jgi:hypothetical protein